jgi:sulfoxide reductase heme-binding subunit YedZ
MIGLYAFFYVCVHLTLYLAIDQGLDIASIVRDVLKRPYITFGMVAFLTLVPLAVTSTNKMIARLGPRRWRQLHRAVYAAAALGVVHYYLLVKLDITWPLFYGAILAVALGWRIANRAPARRAALSSGYKA